jgi:hypothetical protein
MNKTKPSKKPILRPNFNTSEPSRVHFLRNFHAKGRFHAKGAKGDGFAIFV